MVAEIRKRTTASVLKAREALVASNGDMEKALEWLDNDRISGGEQKAQKVGKRFTGEGLIGVSVVTRGSSSGAGMVPQGTRAAMIELNCETDYVGTNELFRKLAQDLAFTVAYLGETSRSSPFMTPMDISYIQNAPLIRRDVDNTITKPVTVAEAIRDLIYACSENITFRRAVSFVHDMIPMVSGVGLRAASYVHGALPNSNPSSQVSAVIEAQGRIGALAAVGLRTAPESRLSELFKDPAFERDLQVMERGLSRQIAGMSPLSIRDGPNALYDQSFDLLGTAAYAGQPVDQVLENWSQERNMVSGNTSTGLDVLEFVRWEVGGWSDEENLS
ncbi:hypothetical protein Clacol_003364 [Clathrus columnatus]|uniref:Elongation factor Ts, mitochondrial n=1 Tax=Clathrus columnatus TaxID=1419009 RepID=A0AAV5A655_9AGAM|nr:hypothetical protein Clacol_003364 [Clathrus columnatus]